MSQEDLEPILFEFVRSPTQRQINNKSIDQFLDDLFLDATFLNTIKTIVINGIANEQLNGLPSEAEIKSFSGNQFREIVKKILLEYAGKNLYWLLEDALLKKAFPQTVGDVFSNFTKYSGDTILTGCLQLPPEESPDLPADEIIDVSCNALSHIDNIFEEDGVAYRRSTMNSIYVRVGATGEKIFISGGLIITFNLSDGTHKIEGSPVLVDLVSKQYSKEKRESPEYWKSYADKVQKAEAAKTNLIQFIKKQYLPAHNDCLIEDKKYEDMAEELKELVTAADQNKIKPQEIIEGLGKKYCSINLRLEIYALFSNVRPTKNLMDNDFKTWMREKLEKIEKKAGISNQPVEVSFNDLYGHLSQKREEVATQIYVLVNKEPENLTKEVKQLNFQDSGPIQALSKKENMQSVKNPGLTDTNLEQKQQELTQIENRMAAVTNLEKNYHDGKTTFISIDDAIFIFDHYERIYAPLEKTKMDEVHQQALNQLKPICMYVLKSLELSYDNQSSPENKNTIKAFLEKVEKSPIITTHTDPFSFKSIVGWETASKTLATKIKGNILGEAKASKESNNIKPRMISRVY